MAKANYNSEGRWTKPSKRAEGYAKDRKAKVHTYFIFKLVKVNDIEGNPSFTVVKLKFV